MAEWRPIDTAPKIEGQYLLGYDRMSADAHGSPDAGVCVIQWIDEDEDEPEFEAGWEVQPFSEGLDCMISETEVTHWMPLPTPPASEVN